MKTPEQYNGTVNVEEAIAGSTTRVVEEVLIGRDAAPQTAKSVYGMERRGVVVEEVLISASTGEELVGKNATEEPQVIADPKTKAALEYKGYQTLVDRAVDVFGDELIASQWLSMPSPDLNGEIPLHVAQELGYEPLRVQQAFEPIFLRIEHGIYF